MPFKDDICHLAGLKQQICQRMILPRDVHEAFQAETEAETEALTHETEASAS